MLKTAPTNVAPSGSNLTGNAVRFEPLARIERSPGRRGREQRDWSSIALPIVSGLGQAASFARPADATSRNIL
jgi:hypothetical protein